MFRTIKRTDVVAGVLAVGAVIAGVRDGKITNLLIAAGMIAVWYAIARRHIFDSFRAGQRSRERAQVIDLEERRASRAAVASARPDDRFR